MKKKDKAVITLEQREMIELERIVIDSDSTEALTYLKKVVKPKVDQASLSMGCGHHI